MTDTHRIRRPARACIALAALLALVLAVPEVQAFGIRERNETNDEPAVEDAREIGNSEETDDAEPADTAGSPGSTNDEPAQGEDHPDDDGNDDESGKPDDEAPPDEESAETEEEPAVEDDESPEVIAVEEIFLDIHRAPIALPESMTARDLAVQIEADRRLLAELRKEIPYDRAEAELYLRRIRELAAISDPVALVPVANNVIRQAPALFEWLETEYDDPDERARDYYIGGSWAFHRRFEAFRKAVLLTVIRRLDAIGYILQGDQE